MTSVLLFSAFSKTGKTTFLRELIPFFVQKGIPVGYIKHHHGNYYGKREKDTAVIHQAGVRRTILVAEDAVVIEDPPPSESCQDPIHTIVKHYFDGYPIVFVEGYKNDRIYPKVVLLRKLDEDEKSLLHHPNIIAVITDKKLSLPCPVYGFDEKMRFFKYITTYFHLAV